MVTSDIRYSCGLADEMGANAFPHFDHLELISQLEQMPRVLVCVSDRLRDNHTVTFTVSLEWKRNSGFRLLLRQLRHSDGGIGPHHRSPGYRPTPFDWHEILKSKQHRALSKQAGIPAHEQDFFIEIYPILLRTQN
jgi:hypothetical protein